MRRPAEWDQLWAQDPDDHDRKIEASEDLRETFKNKPASAYVDALVFHRTVLGNPDFIFRKIRSLDGAQESELIGGLCYTKVVPYRHMEDEEGKQRRRYATYPGETFAVFLDDDNWIIDAGFYLCDENGRPNKAAGTERFGDQVFPRTGQEENNAGAADE